MFSPVSDLIDLSLRVAKKARPSQDSTLRYAVITYTLKQHFTSYNM